MVFQINADDDAEIDIALGAGVDHKFMGKSRVWAQGTQLTLTIRDRRLGELKDKINLLVAFEQCCSPFGKNASKTASQLGWFSLMAILEGVEILEYMENSFEN